MRSLIIATIVMSATLTACSSRPREFTPTLSIAPADQSQFDSVYESCRTQVANGKRSGFGSGRAGSAAAGVAGAAAGAGVGAVALSGATFATYGAAATAAAASIVLIPVAGVVAAVGMAKHKRAKKEREINTALSQCLSENGFEVVGWTKAKRSSAKPPIQDTEPAEPNSTGAGEPTPR